MTRAATEVGRGTPMEQAVAVNKGEGDTIYAAFADSDGSTTGINNGVFFCGFILIVSPYIDRLSTFLVD